MTGRLRGKLRELKDSPKTKNVLVFLIFVVIAAVFWVFMALNDDLQDRYAVKLQIENVPDSVTFINLPPKEVNVVVRDRGINLLRYNVGGTAMLKLDFNEFRQDGDFLVTRPRLLTALRRVFGSEATISSVSPDSIKLEFTELPGKKLPIEPVYSITPAAGMVMTMRPELETTTAVLYTQNRVDTLHRLYTEKVVVHDLDRPLTLEVPIVCPPGARVIPDKVTVSFMVEPLVKKEAEVSVTGENVPKGQDILFFPSKVKVVYYVPMSRYNEDASGIVVCASFNEAEKTSSDKVGVRVVSQPSYVTSLELLNDSVEYTLVRER